MPFHSFTSHSCVSMFLEIPCYTCNSFGQNQSTGSFEKKFFSSILLLYRLLMMIKFCSDFSQCSHQTLWKSSQVHFRAIWSWLQHVQQSRQSVYGAIKRSMTIIFNIRFSRTWQYRLVRWKENISGPTTSHNYLILNYSPSTSIRLLPRSKHKPCAQHLSDHSFISEQFYWWLKVSSKFNQMLTVSTQTNSLDFQSHWQSFHYDDSKHQYSSFIDTDIPHDAINLHDLWFHRCQLPDDDQHSLNDPSLLSINHNSAKSIIRIHSKIDLPMSVLCIIHFCLL